jgi:hypothetical protein
MRYLVSLSGGVGSAVAADRVIDRYGRKSVMLWFADTLWESADTYRFIDDCMQRWGGRLYRYADGRNPLQVAEARRIIPNSMIAPCTFELKIKPFRDLLWRLPKPITVVYGLDWSEPQRISQRQHYHRKNGKPRAPVGTARLIHGVYEEYSLLWRPLEYRPYAEVVASWGIAPRKPTPTDLAITTAAGAALSRACVIGVDCGPCAQIPLLRLPPGSWRNRHTSAPTVPS